MRIRQTGLRYVEMSKNAVVDRGIVTAAEYDLAASKARLEFMGPFIAPGLKTTDIVGRKPL